MRFTRNVASYTIDLAEDETRRWAAVIEKEGAVARALVNEAMSEVVVSSRVLKPAGWALEKLYGVLGGRYCGEIAAWAAGLGITTGEATGLSCSYEMSHLWEWLAGVKIPKLGCTAGISWLPGRGLVHVRTLDWDLPSMGNATRLFRFVDDGREFLAVGVTGFVGVVSAMLPGRFSVSINWLPPRGRPRFDFGPAFLLREVMEDIDDYDEALEILENTRLSTPVSFVLCGVEQGQACVIERQQRSAVVRKIESDVLVQANHYQAKRYESANSYWEGDADSWDRLEALERSLTRLGDGASLSTVARCMGRRPVQNETTVQKMIFCPSTGEALVWRRVGR